MQTEEERKTNLQKANEVRLARAALKRQLKRREVRLKDVLKDPPDYIKTMKVFDLLDAQDRWGRSYSLKLMHKLFIAEYKTVGHLTARQLYELRRSLNRDPYAS